MVEINFEKALNQLEGIVEKLESGDLSLEESLKQFEEGMKVTQALNKKLEEASRKVELLMKNPEGSVTRKAFEDAGGSGDEPVNPGERGEISGPDVKPKKRKGKAGSHDQNTLFE